MSNPTCTIDGCGKPARSGVASLCPMHYHRQYRHGDVDRVSSKAASVSHGRRYKRCVAKGHPLATNESSLVYVHRKVLFDHIGDGVHSCHWCGTDIEWFLDKEHPRSIHVDHLNNIGDDNRVENLVPSCRRCNGARGSQRRADALRAQGFWSVNDTISGLRDPAMRRRARVDDRDLKVNLT